MELGLHNAHLDTVPSSNTNGDILFPQRRADIDRWLFVIPEFDINFKLVNLTCHPVTQTCFTETLILPLYSSRGWFDAALFKF